VAPPKLQVSVPRYEFVWLGRETHPQKFAGYRKIPGSPATREIFRGKHIDRLGKDLGHFITELHSIRPPREALVPGYSRKSSLDYWLKFYQQVRKLAYPVLDIKTRKRAELLWTRFIDHFSNVDFKPRLIHSDLSGGNFMIDASTGGLNGVIDWRNTKVGDPARDFMGVFAVSSRLGEQALANYKLDKGGFRERVGLYLKAEPFDDIVTGAQEPEERFKKRFIGEGLRHMRERLV
jgi:aminoglycoside 2''-phosphotransferase